MCILGSQHLRRHAADFFGAPAFRGGSVQVVDRLHGGWGDAVPGENRIVVASGERSAVFVGWAVFNLGVDPHALELFHHEVAHGSHRWLGREVGDGQGCFFFAFGVNTRASVSGFLKDFDGVFDAWSAGIVVAVPVLERQEAERAGQGFFPAELPKAYVLNLFAVDSGDHGLAYGQRNFAGVKL